MALVFAFTTIQAQMGAMQSTHYKRCRISEPNRCVHIYSDVNIIFVSQERIIIYENENEVYDLHVMEFHYNQGVPLLICKNAEDSGEEISLTVYKDWVKIIIEKQNLLLEVYIDEIVKY